MRKMPTIVHKALHRRYCSSLNYFYTKEINQILGKVSSKAYTSYKEIKFDNNEEDSITKYIPRRKFKHKFE